MAKELGISSNYVSLLEGDKKQPSSNLLSSFNRLEILQGLDNLATGSREKFATRVMEAQAEYPRRERDCRTIPVVSWAHAGEAESFEELPMDWQDRVPTECRDEKAFAVRLLGDSMSPLYTEGDMLIVQPSEEIFSGCLAVIRLANDGILFRRVELRGEALHLVPLNPQYRVEDFSMNDVAWAYPVWGMWRQVWS